MKALLTLSFLFAALGLLYLAGFRLNVTPSMPRGIYRLSDSPIRRGDFVGFCLSGPWASLAGQSGYVGSGLCPSGLKPLLKKLAALPGDELLISPAGITVIRPDDPESFWPAPHRSVDGTGRILPASDLRPGRVSPGLGLLLAGHPGSFDGRYFGLVPLTGLTRLEPVFTF